MPDSKPHDPPDDLMPALPPDEPDHPMPPSEARGVSPDSPVGQPPPQPPHDDQPPHDRPPHDRRSQTRPPDDPPDGMGKRQSISSSSGLNRLGGDVSLPSPSQSNSQPSSQPILPTVVVPPPPATLTDPAIEDDDADLELQSLEQEEKPTATPLQSSPPKKQKTGKKKKSDNDSPEQSPRNEPGSSSNFNPNNPANLPMQEDSDEELIPHVPTSSGTGSSQRTLQYTDREEAESDDSQRTRLYDDQDADLVLDEAQWSFMTSDQKRILYGPPITCDTRFLITYHPRSEDITCARKTTPDRTGARYLRPPGLVYSQHLAYSGGLDSVPAMAGLLHGRGVFTASRKRPKNEITDTSGPATRPPGPVGWLRFGWA